MELLPVLLTAEPGPQHSVFGPQSFTAPFLAFLLLAHIWVEVPFFSWAPMTRAVVRSSGRGHSWKESLVEVYQLECMNP